MSAGDSRLNSSANFLSASELRKLRGSEQVAAVCYRIGRSGIEFLLVQTRNGRWTFPKGGVEPGLTHAQTAALEAFEEAGVHGRMEHASFARYVRRKGGAAEVVVHAHLCEVLRLGPPQESNRTPTWFSPEKARRRLQENRTSGSAGEIARVVDCAVARIQRVGAGNSTSIDRLQKVQFEAVDDAGGYGRLLEATFAQYTRREYGEVRQSAAMALAVNAHLSKLLRPRPSGNSRLLTAGEEQRNLTEQGAPKGPRVRRSGSRNAIIPGVAKAVRLLGSGRTASEKARAPRGSPENGRGTSRRHNS